MSPGGAVPGREAAPGPGTARNGATPAAWGGRVGRAHRVLPEDRPRRGRSAARGGCARARAVRRPGRARRRGDAERALDHALRVGSNARRAPRPLRRPRRVRGRSGALRPPLPGGRRVRDRVGWAPYDGRGLRRERRAARDRTGRAGADGRLGARHGALPTRGRGSRNPALGDRRRARGPPRPLPARGGGRARDPAAARGPARAARNHAARGARRARAPGRVADAVHRAGRGLARRAHALVGRLRPDARARVRARVAPAAGRGRGAAHRGGGLHERLGRRRHDHAPPARRRVRRRLGDGGDEPGRVHLEPLPRGSARRDDRRAYARLGAADLVGRRPLPDDARAARPARRLHVEPRGHPRARGGRARRPGPRGPRIRGRRAARDPPPLLRRRPSAAGAGDRPPGGRARFARSPVRRTRLAAPFARARAGELARAPARRCPGPPLARGAGRARRRRARAAAALAGPALGALSVPIRRRAGRRTRGPAALLAGLLACAAVDAAAEGEPDLFTLRPSLSTTVVVDDNPEFERDGGGSSVGAWLRPRVQAEYRAERFDVGADLGVDVRRYSGYDSSLSEEFARISGFADVELAQGLGLRVADAWVPRALRLGRPEDDGENLVQTNHLEGTLRHWRSLPGERELEIGIQGSYFLSEDFAEPVGAGAVDGDFQANYAGGLGYVEVQSPIAGGVNGFLRAQAGYRALADASDADHIDAGGSLGVRVPIGDGSSLELGGGAGWLRFAGLSDRPRAMARAQLRLKLPAGFVSTLAATHLLSANIEGRKFVETDARIEIERYFGRRTAVALGLFGTRFDDASLGAANLFGGGDASVRYQITRATQFVLRYRHWTNGGSFHADDFAQNRATLEIRFHPSVL